MYKEDLALNNLKELICHKTKQNQTNQVSRIFLSILVDLNNVVVQLVTILPLISSSSSLFTWPLRIIPSMPTKFIITITLMFHSFFSPLARSKYLSIFSLSFIFHFVVCQDSKIHWTAISFFLLINTRSGLQVRIRFSFIPQNPREFYLRIFKECGVPHHWIYSQIHSGPEC